MFRLEPELIRELKTFASHGRWWAADRDEASSCTCGELVPVTNASR
jgi:hypothetical protein